MELPIKHKRGTTVPTASDLVVGEIAINTATGLCYTKTGAGNVVAIGLDVAANWGNIGGTLSSQTDLQDSLNLKFPKSGGSLDTDAQLQLNGSNGYSAQFAPSSLWVKACDPINLTFPGGWSSQVILQPDINGGAVYGNKYSYSSDGNGGVVSTLNGAWYLDSTGIHFYDGTVQATAALPLTGGTMTGAINLGDATAYNYIDASGLDVFNQNGETFYQSTGCHGSQSGVGSFNAQPNYLAAFDSLNDSQTEIYGGIIYLQGGGNDLNIIPTRIIFGDEEEGHLQLTDDGISFNNDEDGGPQNCLTKYVRAGITFPDGTTQTTAALSGAAGPAGPAGANGTVWTYRGAYDNGVTYAANDYVTLNGSSYVMINTIGGGGYGPITHPAAWQLVANKGDTGATGAAGTPADLSLYATNASPTFTGTVTIPSGANISGYAQLSGALFTGRVSTVATGSAAGLKIGVSSTTPTTTVPGDIWTGANTLFFKDTSNVLREVVNSSMGNTFTASQVIATPTGSTTSALRITNLATSATAHSLVVEDGTNPDTTSFIVNNAGNVGIGKNPATWTPTQKLEVDGYVIADTAPFDDQSTKLATTANVKASICGSVGSAPSSGWQVSYSTGYPNQIIRVYNDSTSGMMSVPTETHIPVGTRYTFVQTEDLPFSFSVEGGGSQLFSFENKFTSAGLYAVCNLIKTAAYEWFLTGDLVASVPAGTFISAQCVYSSVSTNNGNNTMYGDWGYEVTRANGSGGTYATIECDNCNGCYHTTDVNYTGSSSDIYFPGPFGDVNVGMYSEGTNADGFGGTYFYSGNSYSAGCDGTYAQQATTDMNGLPQTTYWKIDCNNNTYYTQTIYDAGVVMSQSCSTALSTDAAGVQWTVGVLVQQISNGAGGSYENTVPNYSDGMYQCGAYPSGYATYYLGSTFTFSYFAPEDGQENDGVTGTYETLSYGGDTSATYSDGTYFGYYSVGPSPYTNYSAGYVFYQWSNGAGRNYFLHFDGSSGYYETNDGG